MICLEDFGTAVASFKLEDLAAPQWNDLNGNGVADIGDSFSYTVENVPTSGFVYLNIHLDYGLKQTDGWKKAGTDGVNAYNEDLAQLIVDDDLDTSGYGFSATANGNPILDSEDEVFANVVFKKSWGIGGMVTDDDGLVPLEGEMVSLYKGTQHLGSAQTDEDGWYTINYQHKGKAAPYSAQWDVSDDVANLNGLPLDTVDVSDPFTLGGSTKYVQVDFDADAVL